MPDDLAAGVAAASQPTTPRARPESPKPGATVIGADGARLGMVSALVPDSLAPTHLLVFVAERQQLIPREYPLPLSSVVRVDDNAAVHVAVTRDGLRGGEQNGS